MEVTIVDTDKWSLYAHSQLIKTKISYDLVKSLQLRFIFTILWAIELKTFFDSFCKKLFL